MIFFENITGNKFTNSQLKKGILFIAFKKIYIFAALIKKLIINTLKI